MSERIFKFVYMLCVVVTDCFKSYMGTDVEKFYLFLFPTFQILGWCIILFFTPQLEQIEKRRAFYLAVVIASPFMLTSMLLRCFVCKSFNLIFLPPLAMTATVCACTYLSFHSHPMPLLLHLPGIFLICVFCYGIATSNSERVLSLIYIAATCLCIVASFYYHTKGHPRNAKVYQQFVASCMSLVLLNFGFAEFYYAMIV